MAFKIVDLEEKRENLDDEALAAAVGGSFKPDEIDLGDAVEAGKGNDWWRSLTRTGMVTQKALSDALFNQYSRLAESYHYRYFSWPQKARGLSEEERVTLARSYMLRLLVLTQLVRQFQRERILIGEESFSYIFDLYEEAATDFRNTYGDMLFISGGS